MVFDYKKEYKDLYFPKKKPELITIPEMNYLAVSGSGDPNKEDGTYKNALEMLYSVAYTIKMSKKGEHKILGLCVQQMHIGSYDDEPTTDEPTTIENIHKFVKSENCQIDIKNPRYHHEIYLSDPRRTRVDRVRTVIRLPIK